jgi:hypothetical protein
VPKPYRQASLEILIIDLTLTRAYKANTGLRRQLIEQSLRLLQIERVETFGKPPVNRRQQFARLR